MRVCVRACVRACVRVRVCGGRGLSGGVAAKAAGPLEDDEGAGPVRRAAAAAAATVKILVLVKILVMF